MNGPEKEQQATAPETVGQDHAHSHHHEHHGHHHKSRQKKKRRYRNKILSFITERKKQLAGVLVFLAILITLIVLIFMEADANWKAQGILPDGTGETSPTSQQMTEPVPLAMELPWMPDRVPVTGDAVQALMSADHKVPAEQVLAPYRKENDRLDVGLPVELRFDMVSLPLGEQVDHFRVDIWKEGAEEDVQSFELKASRRSLDLTCLEADAQYRYEIAVFLTGGTEHTMGGTFRTQASPRIISVGGVRNVRDLGGWTTEDGRKLRQGLLYRGSELDGAVEDHLRISDIGRQDMLSRLGIRLELDLREPGMGANALGANVRHTYLPVPSYGGVFSEEGKASVRQVFETLADPDAYPVYLHGTHGVDRTGTVCYLLQALLGLSEEDLIREYELSALAYESVDRQKLAPVTEVLKTYGGTDLAQNVELYLLSAGVSQAQIDSIRQIWLY